MEVNGINITRDLLSVGPSAEGLGTYSNHDSVVSSDSGKSWRYQIALGLWHSP